MLNTIIQIILSIFLIAIMAFISYSVYNREFISSIVKSNTNKKITKIFTGILDYSIVTDIDIETYDKNDFSYLDINPSINQNGGSEYSYNFWLFFSPNGTNIITSPSINPGVNIKSMANDARQNIETSANVDKQYIVLFYKGESQPLIYNTNNNYDCNNTDTLYDYPILVKNPLIKIKNDASEIIVEYNNINHPETYNSAGNTTIDCTTDGGYEIRNHNKFGIKDIDVNNYKDKFNMVTVVFQEQSKKDNIFNGNKLNCKVYFNGQLKADKLSNTNSIEEDEIKNFKSRVMKSNLSKLHINPIKINNTITKHKLSDNITDISPLQMADLTYYNYALTNTEIKNLYENGFNKYDASFKKRISNSYTKGFNNKDYKINPI
jgi:hypothetical protein